MSKRLLIAVTSAGLLLGGAAMAQNSGSSSGPATGKGVEPSTAIQKEEGRSADQGNVPTGAGAPGIEAKPGTQSGALPENNKDNNMGSDKSQ
jgi:hypothetical protein